MSHSDFNLHTSVTNDVKHLVMSLFALCVSLVRCLFKSFADFFFFFEGSVECLRSFLSFAISFLFFYLFMYSACQG